MKTLIQSILSKIIEKYVTESYIKELVRQEVISKIDFHEANKIISNSQKEAVEKFLSSQNLNRDEKIKSILSNFLKYNIWNIISNGKTFKEIREMEDKEIIKLISIKKKKK
jgi:hypothetical protein